MEINKVKVQDIPYCKLTGFEPSDRDGFLFMLKMRDEVHNHLQTLHAGALFTLAESTSGQFLLSEFSHLNESLVPVIRKSEIKYSKPGTSTVYARAAFINQSKEEIEQDLLTRKKVIIKVNVEVLDENDQRILQSNFDWFVACLS